jgi:hypothetical protein
MKKLLLAFLTVFILCSDRQAVSSQTALNDTRALIWGCSPFQDSMWAIDTTNWQVVTRLAPSLPSFTITGMNGMATDPTDGQTYVIMKVSAVSGRVLGRINLSTGVVTQVGNLGDNFSSITFDETGQLYGATGDGATASETLYKIDKTTGVKTLQFAMGNGADGEIITYNRDDNHIYHWSGNGTVVFEKFPATNVTYTPTNIPLTGGPGGETFGSIYLGNNKFINSNISSSFVRINTSGVYSPSFGSLPDDWRGLVMIPYISASDDSICENETLSMTAGGHQLYSHLIFHWGDASFDSVTTSYGVLANASHTYSNPGNYTVHVVTWNGFTGDTIYSYAVNVLNIPVVGLAGPSFICGGDSVTLTGSSGGTSQWYFNGNPIVGANTNTYSTNVAGIYNMTKTNLNGCSDSAATGINLVLVANPVVALGNDGAYCGSAVLDAANVGATYVWNDNSTQQTLSATTSGLYYVAVTDSNGCSGSDSINVTINALPVVNLGADTAICGGSIILNAGNSGASYVWNDASTSQTLTASASGIYFVTVTDSNACATTDSISVTVNQLPTVTVSALQNNMCINDPPIPLTGTPAGGTFSGNGVSPNTFTPSVAGAGVWMAYYSVTDSIGCSATDSVQLTVNASPVITISATSTNVCFDDADVTLSATPTGGTFSGPGVTGTTFDPSVAGNGVQTVTYTYTDVNSCTGSTTINITVNACVGIEENSATPFTMFPNPSNGNVTLNLNYNNSFVEVVDVLGNTISSQRYTNAGQVQLNLNNASEGIYFVRVTSGNEKSVQKLIIRK